jgi:hypothetical protein
MKRRRGERKTRRHGDAEIQGKKDAETRGNGEKHKEYQKRKQKFRGGPKGEGKRLYLIRPSLGLFH